MSILMVTGMEGARNCAAVVGTQLGKEVQVAEGRKAALAALRRREFAAVVVDETIAECDPAAAEAIWACAGLAIPCRSTSRSPERPGSSARFAPHSTGASGNSHWLARRQPWRSRPN